MNKKAYLAPRTIAIELASKETLLSGSDDTKIRWNDDETENNFEGASFNPGNNVWDDDWDN